MPCVENFQALISVEGKYLEEFKPRWIRQGSGTTVDSLVESPVGKPYKIIIRTIKPKLQETDLIAYVLVDGHLVGSRILRKTDADSSCQISGMSLSRTGLGPVELADKVDGKHLNKKTPAVPGSIRILVYRGIAKKTGEPSLFNYPTFICPFFFVDNPRQEECSGLEHITALAEPVPVTFPSTTYTFHSSDNTGSPLVTVDFFYRSDKQLTEQLNRVPAAAIDIPRSLSPPFPAPLVLRPRIKIESRPIASHYRIIELGGGGNAKDLQLYEVSSERALTSLPSPVSTPLAIAPLSFSYDSDISSHGLAVTGPISSFGLPNYGSPASSSTPTSIDPNLLPAPLHLLPSTNVFKNKDHYQQHQQSSSLLRTNEILIPIAKRRSPLEARTANLVPHMEIQASRMGSPAISSKGKARRGSVVVGLVKKEDQEQVAIAGGGVDQGKEREERASRRARPYPAGAVGGRTGGRGR